MYIAWCYRDRSSGKYYYTESYSMSVTDFAERVSYIVGYTVEPADTCVASSRKYLNRPNLIHI